MFTAKQIVDFKNFYFPKKENKYFNNFLKQKPKKLNHKYQHAISQRE